MVTETRGLVLDHSALHLLSAVSFCPTENGGSNLPAFLLFAVPVIAAVMLLVQFLRALCSKLEQTEPWSGLLSSPDVLVVGSRLQSACSFIWC